MRDFARRLSPLPPIRPLPRDVDDVVTRLRAELADVRRRLDDASLLLDPSDVVAAQTRLQLLQVEADVDAILRRYRAGAVPLAALISAVTCGRRKVAALSSSCIGSDGGEG